MTPAPAPDPQAAQREQFLLLLQVRSVAELRNIRAWGWPLKGTAKNDIVEQLAGYLLDLPQDARRLRRAVAHRGRYPPLAQLQAQAPSAAGLAAALSHVEQRRISAEEEYSTALQVLYDRGLVFTTPLGTLAISRPIPGLAAGAGRCPGCARANHSSPGRFSARASSTRPSTGSSHASRASGPPRRPANPRPPSAPAAVPGPSQAARPAQQGRPGHLGLRSARRATLPASSWSSWSRPDRQDIERGRKRLVVDAEACATWESTAPHSVLRLREWWTAGGSRPAYRTTSMWNELDLAIGSVAGYTLRYSTPWVDAFAASFRRPVPPMAGGPAPEPRRRVAEDRVRPPHLPSASGAAGHRQHRRIRLWYDGGKVLGLARMDWPTWRATNGCLVEALLTGPLQWLGRVVNSNTRGSGRWPSGCNPSSPSRKSASRRTCSNSCARMRSS